MSAVKKENKQRRVVTAAFEKDLPHKREAVQIVSTKEVQPHPRNQSIYADEPDKELIEDIERRGILQPLICEEGTGHIISGRRRYKAAQTIGIKFVPVIYRTYEKEEDLIEAIIMHNAYRRKSERQIMLEIEALWDTERQQNQIIEQAESSEDSKTNKKNKKKFYRRKSADTISQTVGRTVSASKVGLAVSIIKKAKDEMGESWQDHPSVQAVFKGKASINSTALNIRKNEREKKLLKKADEIINLDIDLRHQDNIDDIANESVDHIITDPQYDIETGYGARMKEDPDFCVDVFEGWNTELMLDELSAWCHEWARVIKNGGNIAIFCDGRYLSFMMEALTSNGFENPEYVVWHMTNPKVSGGGNRYEFVDSCRFIVTASMTSKQRSVFKWHGIKKMHNFIEGANVNSKGKKSYKNRGQLPQYVIKWLLERITNPGDTVLDNFAGTGTVGLACKKLKRNFILVEKDKKNVGIIKTRFAANEDN